MEQRKRIEEGEYLAAEFKTLLEKLTAEDLEELEAIVRRLRSRSLMKPKKPVEDRLN